MSRFDLSQDAKARTNPWARLRELFKGDETAVSLVYDLYFISHVWDDLVDGDKPVSPDVVSKAFQKALIDVNLNRFFRDNAAMILPVLLNATLLWHGANDLERDGGQHALEVAHVIRCAGGDIAMICAAIIGGTDYAKRHAAEIRMLAQQDCLADYLADWRKP
jgi:hypothetical protein